MPPKKSTADEKADLNNAITVDDIASVAASSVNGFLMNVAKGVRRAQAEGGKGTRRRVELYISTEIGQPTHGEGIKTDDDKSRINTEGVKAEGGGAVSAAAALSLTSASNGVEADFADVFHGNDWSGAGDDAFFDADGEAAADGDWDEYDLDIDGDADEAFDSSLTKAKEQAATAKQEADGPNRSERPPAAAVVKPESSVGDGSSFVPPPPAVTGPHTMRDPAYEQMMADHHAAAAKARQIRLAGLKRTVNKLMATVVRGKLVDRWASSIALREALMGKHRGLDAGERQNGISACDMRSRVREAVHQLRCAVGPLFTSQRQVAILSGLKIHSYDGLAACRGAIEIENSSSNPNAAALAVKPTHAPLWVTADQALGGSTATTPANNPFIKAITEFLVRISRPVGVKNNTAIDDDAAVFFFDPTPWAEVFLKESHSLPDTGAAQLIADLDAKLREEQCNASRESTALGKKRPRRPDDGCVGEMSNSDHVAFRRPWEYVACVLALLRAAGVPSRLVMAAENPPPPADAVNVNFDDGEDEAGEANLDDNDNEPNEGGHLAVLKKFAAAGKSSAATAESKTPSARGAKKGNKEGKSTKPNITASAALIPTVCSHFWIEAFDPLRQSVVSVNPIPGLTTRFGAPYTFAFDSVEVKGSTNMSDELKEGAQCAGNDDSNHVEVLLLDESDNEESALSVSLPSPGQTILPCEQKDDFFCNERVVDVTVRYVPKYSAVYGRRIDKHCRPYRKLLWPDTFFNVKDYEEDKLYGVMDHVLVKMNAMFRGEYTFDCGTRGDGPNNGGGQGTSLATKVCSPSSRELSKLISALDEDDATRVMMVFGSVQLEDEDCGDTARASPEKGVLVEQISPKPTSPTSKSSSSPWVPFYYEREAVQLEKLLYAEPSPTTLAEAKYHPLYVLEKDLGRHEAIYPKDKTTVVGTIRGSFVYKRTAVVALRSRDGWLREGRSLMTQEEWEKAKVERQGQLSPDASAEPPKSDSAQPPQCFGSELVPPYRVVPPPPSRPLAPASKFYGYWQTKPFVPLPLTSKGAIPRHGNTNWYMLMGADPPSSLVRVIEPVGASVARRINVEYRQAVIGFVKKEWAGPGAGFGSRGGWGGGFGGGYEAKIEGIVIKASDEVKFRTAMAEYVALLEEQEARRRSQRARNWWNAFAQRLLANDRMQEMFHRGNTAH